MNLSEHLLNLARIVPQSRVNGPGTRCVIWFQGCSIRCPGCVNQELWPHEAGQLLSVQDVCEQILTMPGIEGVTYSGGEPFDQAAGAYALSRLLQQANLSVMAYSGHTYQELLESDDAEIAGLLSTLDILIDGPFEQAQAAPLLWRGSRNQQVRFLTPRYAPAMYNLDDRNLALEFAVTDREFGMTGNFDTKLLQKITTKLQQDYGIMITNTSDFQEDKDG